MKQFVQVIKKAAYRHGYLLLIAAWLYTISFVFTNYWSYSSSPEKVKNSLENYIASQEQSFQSIVSDNFYLHTIVNNPKRFKNEHLQSLPIGLFAYAVNAGGDLVQEVFWNTSQMTIDVKDLHKKDGNYVVKYHNGWFELLKRTVTVNKKPYIVAGLVPLYWEYFIQNNYLNPQFASFNTLGELYRLSSDPDAIAIKNSSGNTLFRIQLIKNDHVAQPDAISITLRFITILLLLFFFNTIAKELCLQRSFYHGLFFFRSGIVTIPVICLLHSVSLLP